MPRINIRQLMVNSFVLTTKQLTSTLYRCSEEKIELDIKGYYLNAII